MSNQFSHINPAILIIAKEIGAEVTLTGASHKGQPARNQAMLNGRFVGFYAQKSFGGDGSEGWQLGSGRIKGSRDQAAHFIRTGELPVDGEAAPRKAISPKKEDAATQQTQAVVDPIMARLQLVQQLKSAGISDELIAMALKG